MRSIAFLANVASPHVRHWVGIVDKKVHIDMHSIHRLEGELEGQGVTVRTYGWSRLPALLRYIYLGLRLRSHVPRDIVHAHNTSGYGLSALLCGSPYIVTTYGSEIFDARKKSLFYRGLIRLILRSATFITCTTSAMEEALVADFDVPRKKIRCFSLGVGEIFLALPRYKSRIDSSVTWLCNRRMRSLYNIEMIVEAFHQYLESGGKGELWLMEGDADESYVSKITEKIGSERAIKIIKGFIEQTEIVEILDQVHYVISIPDSDQLSSSILEGAARGAVPVLRALDAYDAVAGIAVCLPKQIKVRDLLEMFQKTGAHDVALWQLQSVAARDFIEGNYSAHQAYMRYEQVLLEMRVKTEEIK